jgi:acyl-CoA synthetase (NDP forming)
MLGAGYDFTFLVLDQPREDRGLSPDAGFAKAREAMIAAASATGASAGVVASLPESMREDDAASLMAAGVAPLQGISEALTAIGHAADYAAARARRASLAPLANTLPVDPASARLLSERDGKRLLALHGLEVPPSRLASAVEAASTAAAIGFPVALKIASDDIFHKSDVGGVMLGLRSRADVNDAVDRMSHLGNRFLVERMVDGAVAELLVGVVRDPQFGPTLTVGAGGVMVELLQDTRRMLLPVTADEVRDALMSLRMARLLDGYRGKPKGDIRAAVKAIMAIAEFALRNRDKLIELDVNPLFVLPEGRGAIAADALVRMIE